MPYPGSTKAAGGPIGFIGKSQVKKQSVFLPLSAFFLQIHGEGDDEEPVDGAMTGYRKKGGKKKEKKTKRNDQPAGTGDAQANKGIVDRSVAGSDKSVEESTKKPPLDIKWNKIPPSPEKPFEAAGYTADSPMGHVKLAKEKKGRGITWVMTVGKHRIDLGKKARFDHAEGELLKLYKSEGITVSSGIATTPIPIGSPLKRVMSNGSIKKKKSKDELKKWANSLMAMTGANR